jgi:hypothetical protein
MGTSGSEEDTAFIFSAEVLYVEMLSQPRRPPSYKYSWIIFFLEITQGKLII